jgi:PAS domain S-box-containing protein
MEIRIVPRGETRWVHMTGRCSRDASGTPIRWAGSVTDITARKRVDEELRARQDMLELAQKAARAVAFEWRLAAGEGENRWSPDLEVMYGIEIGSYDGTYESWKKLVHPEDWPNVRAAIKSAQTTGDADAEYRVVHRIGAIRWLQAKGRVFFDPRASRHRIVGFMLDVTDRHARRGRNCGGWSCSCARRSVWKRWGRSPAASRTTSTISSARYWVTGRWRCAASPQAAGCIATSTTS